MWHEWKAARGASGRAGGRTRAPGPRAGAHNSAAGARQPAWHAEARAWRAAAPPTSAAPPAPRVVPLASSKCRAAWVCRYCGTAVPHRCSMYCRTACTASSVCSGRVAGGGARVGSAAARWPAVTSRSRAAPCSGARPRRMHACLHAALAAAHAPPPRRLGPALPRLRRAPSAPGGSGSRPPAWPGRPRTLAPAPRGAAPAGCRRTGRPSPTLRRGSGAGTAAAPALHREFKQRGLRWWRLRQLWRVDSTACTVTARARSAQGPACRSALPARKPSEAQRGEHVQQQCPPPALQIDQACAAA